MNKILFSLVNVVFLVNTVLSQTDTVFYHENGMVYSISKTEKNGFEVLESHKNDLLDGITVLFEGERIISITSYKNGQEDGYRYGFNNSGLIQTVTLYDNGEAHYYAEFYSSGMKKYEHVDNELECYSRFWNETGELISEGRCIK